MKDNHIRIGDDFLLSFLLEGKWSKKDLWMKLMDEHAIMEDPFDQEKYEFFYLKIRGNYYAADLVPEDLLYIAYPYNPHNRKYDDYNSLRNEKVPVLVLYSDNCNFRDYGVYASYFTDKPENPKSPNIELWGEKMSYMKSIIRKLGF